MDTSDDLDQDPTGQVWQFAHQRVRIHVTTQFLLSTKSGVKIPVPTEMTETFDNHGHSQRIPTMLFHGG